MAKIKKRGTSGQAKNYITRTQAVRKLQLSLADFRRLCIFKGIYPREPRNKKKASKSATQSTTFYYTKDIQYLLHEPLLAKFRDHKALGKKIARALGRNEISDAQRLEKNLTPRLTLDHLIKERYPTFVDALRDLDDALSMLFLFANLPQTNTVPPKTIALCQRLTLEFEHYIIRSHSLRKSFLSIKGIYYQATIQGQDILWLVPYKFVQRVTGDIDFRIMGTFVEFYTTLLGFVNYRLYTSMGLVYPPKFNADSSNNGGELGAFRLEDKIVAQPQLTNGSANARIEAPTSAAAQAEADKLISTQSSEAAIPSSYETAPEEPNGNDDTAEDFKPIDPSADTLLRPSISTSTVATLFEPCTFFLSRETPRHPLEFLLRAFGCKRVGWDALLGDGSYAEESDSRITHQIVDRPVLATTTPTTDGQPTSTSNPRVAGRTYIQPQWVWDCINAGKLLRTDIYAPGAELPPHLSPFVRAKKGEYDPTKSLAEQELEGEAAAAAEADAIAALRGPDDDDEELEDADVAEARGAVADVLLESGVDVATGEGMDVELANEEDSESDAVEADEDFTGFDSDAEESDADPAAQHQAELEAEARGLDAGSTPGKALKDGPVTNKAQQKRDKERKERDDELDRQKMMLSRRKRKLFEKMTFGNNKRDEAAEKLRGKRRKLEKEGKVKGARV